MTWLLSNWRVVLAFLLVVFIAALLLGLGHYRDNAVRYKNQRDTQKSLADNRLAVIDEMTRRQLSVASIDAKYTKDLADAQKTISDLRRDVDSGAKRLRVSAKCDRPVSGKSSATGVDDDGSPRLTDAAQWDYFTLRERIETVTKQLTGLQDYVRQVCLTPAPSKGK
ncbi:lysis protein [Pantoea stewartii]|uniref:Endopeptidase n=1 Tax=Pantoea stewartii TaxID=66269 RepID=A0AB34VKR8_9GAMM|nr:lysis protein [Pantoea stewartii]KTS74247.1 endopeptidase [Pantoea stewartii]KTT00952.1 endopeptidase [Pantoea stewartii]KTT08469.1 endopeptidase [Pantoea stewartii]